MTYFASCGEALLIAALLLASHRAFHSHRDTKVKYILSLAMLFIATTATLGLLRFAGASSLISIHDTLSWFSTHFAMPIYAVLTALCFVADKRHLSRLLLALLLINSAFVFANVLLLTNVVIFIALVIAAFASRFCQPLSQRDHPGDGNVNTCPPDPVFTDFI